PSAGGVILVSFTSPCEEHSFVVLRRRGRGPADHSTAGAHPTTAKTTATPPRNGWIGRWWAQRYLICRPPRDDGAPADRRRRGRRPADRDRAARKRLSEAGQTASAGKLQPERQPDWTGLGITD